HPDAAPGPSCASNPLRARLSHPPNASLPPAFRRRGAVLPAVSGPPPLHAPCARPRPSPRRASAPAVRPPASPRPASPQRPSPARAPPPADAPAPGASGLPPAASLEPRGRPAPSAPAHVWPVPPEWAEAARLALPAAESLAAEALAAVAAEEAVAVEAE